jgi:type 1 glutamine amidotransferase
MRLAIACIAGLGAFLIGVHGAWAFPEANCPLANEPYSADTVMADLLLDPKTRAVLEVEAPMLAKPGPGFPSFSEIPGFGTILQLREAAKWAALSDDIVTQIDVQLRAIPVTRAATVARCARYDTVRPALPASPHHPAILVFEKIVGFKDGPSFMAGHAALEAMAARRGWTLVVTDNGAAFNAADLSKFDAVVWNNVSGDALTIEQEAAFKTYIEAGGGFAGFHGSGGDPYYPWGWYADTLIGARFLGHPMNPQFQSAHIKVDDPESGITKGLGEGWTLREEWYSFKTSPRLKGAHILASLDEASYAPGARLAMGDHPIAWTQCIGNGRSFYSAIGHLPENYTEPHSASLLEQGIAWALGTGVTTCKQGVEIAR